MCISIPGINLVRREIIFGEKNENSHPTSDQGDVGSNPAKGNYSFPQKLSSVEFPISFSQFLLNLDCESICDPPGGDTLLAQGIYLTDYIYIYSNRV